MPWWSPLHPVSSRGFRCVRSAARPPPLPVHCRACPLSPRKPAAVCSPNAPSRGPQAPATTAPLPVSTEVSMWTLRTHTSPSKTLFVSGFSLNVTLLRLIDVMHEPAHTCLLTSAHNTLVLCPGACNGHTGPVAGAPCCCRPRGGCSGLFIVPTVAS